MPGRLSHALQEAKELGGRVAQRRWALVWVARQDQLLGDRGAAGESPEGQLDAAATRALALGREEGEPRLGLREALFCALCAGSRCSASERKACADADSAARKRRSAAP